MKRPETREELQAHLDTLISQGQGCWEMHLYTAEGVLDAFIAHVVGGGRHTLIWHALEGMVAQVTRADPPVICLTCDNALGEDAMPGVWVMLHPHTATPKGGMGNGICMACCLKADGDLAAISRLASDTYREKMIPDLRVITPGAPGHG